GSIVRHHEPIVPLLRAAICTLIGSRQPQAGARLRRVLMPSDDRAEAPFASVTLRSPGTSASDDVDGFAAHAFCDDSGRAGRRNNILSLLRLDSGLELANIFGMGSPRNRR